MLAKPLATPATGIGSICKIKHAGNPAEGLAEAAVEKNIVATLKIKEKLIYFYRTLCFNKIGRPLLSLAAAQIIWLG
jgi:hypothetical protein